jgi:microcystin-dependent protein
MLDGTIGEIRLWAGSFVPVEWVECDGREVLKSDYGYLYLAMGGEIYAQWPLFRLPAIDPPAPGLRYVVCWRGAWPMP